MADLLEITENASDKVLDVWKKGQEFVLDGNRWVADAVEENAPEDFPADRVPTVEGLPTLRSGAKVWFDFREKMLASNRKFTEDVMDVWSPAVKKFTDNGSAAPKKAPAKKTAASKPAAKKAPATKAAAPKAETESKA